MSELFAAQVLRHARQLEALGAGASPEAQRALARGLGFLRVSARLAEKVVAPVAPVIERVEDDVPEAPAAGVAVAPPEPPPPRRAPHPAAARDRVTAPQRVLLAMPPGEPINIAELHSRLDGMSGAHLSVVLSKLKQMGRITQPNGPRTAYVKVAGPPIAVPAAAEVEAEAPAAPAPRGPTLLEPIYVCNHCRAQVLESKRTAHLLARHEWLPAKGDHFQPLVGKGA